MKRILCVGILLASNVCSAVNVRDFGAKGDAITDDTAAIRKALAASREVHFPAGVYVLSDGIDLPDSALLSGDGSPTLGTTLLASASAPITMWRCASTAPRTSAFTVSTPTFQ